MDLYRDDVSGNLDYDGNGGLKECINFTVHTAQSVLAIKMSLSSFAIVANLAVIVFILYTKKIRDFMYRLILYLMITDVLQAFAIIIISLPVVVPNDTAPAQIRPGKRWSDTCIGSGFAIMATMWMGNIIVFWIVLYLLWLGWGLYRRVYRKRQNNKISHSIHQAGGTSKFIEILGVIFLFAAPIVISIIPLFAHGDMYGLSGLWCWIKLHTLTCGDLGTIPLAFALVFFYAPLMVIVLLVFAFIMATFICCCRGEVRRHDKNKELKKRYTKEIVIIFAFPLAYCCICIVLLINRIYTTVHQRSDDPPYAPLWIAHAIADPLRIVLPALVFLINPYVWKDARAHTLAFSSSTNEDEPLPESRGVGKNYKSCDDDYEVTLVN